MANIGTFGVGAAPQLWGIAVVVAATSCVPAGPPRPYVGFRQQHGFCVDWVVASPSGERLVSHQCCVPEGPPRKFPLDPAQQTRAQEAIDALRKLPSVEREESHCPDGEFVLNLVLQEPAGEPRRWALCRTVGADGLSRYPPAFQEVLNLICDGKMPSTGVCDTMPNHVGGGAGIPAAKKGITSGSSGRRGSRVNR